MNSWPKIELPSIFIQNLEYSSTRNPAIMVFLPIAVKKKEKASRQSYPLLESVHESVGLWVKGNENVITCDDWLYESHHNKKQWQGVCGKPSS